MGSFSPVCAQNWNLILVDIEVQAASLVEIFDILADESEYEFRYEEKVMNLEESFRLVYRRASLKEVLEDLAHQAGLKLKARKSTISVVLKDRPTGSPLLSSAPIVVQGKIIDVETQKPLVGANIQVPELKTGVITDQQGHFTLKVGKKVQTIVVSYWGYTSATIPLHGKKHLDIRLSPDYHSQVEEVVLIGYGEQSRRKVTGAISKINAEDFSQYAASGFDQQLIGTLAGVQINQVNGQPGSDAQVIICGLGTLTAGSHPLIVVDGVPLAEGTSLNSISPSAIESVSILKDAASAAIYGSRASNGVILISTKSGVAGSMKVRVETYGGIQMRADQVTLADAYSAAQFFTEARDWGYVSRDLENREATHDEATRIANGANKRELRLAYVEPYLNGEPGLTNTDWLDEIFRKSAITSTKASFSGGNSSGNYLVISEYFRQEGLAIGTSYERIGGLAKITTDLNRKIQFRLNITPSYSIQDYTNLGHWSEDPIAASMIYYPFFDAYEADGRIALSQGQLLNKSADGSLQENPLAYAEIKDDRFRFRIFGKAALTYDILPDLQFITSIGGDYRNYFFDFFKPSTLGEYRAIAPIPAQARETNGRVLSYVTENTLRYHKSIGEHDIDLFGVGWRCFEHLRPAGWHDQQRHEQLLQQFSLLLRLLR
ncbi:MAG: SusC/RagA family TonB-linked outer membrane protein, partial [Bacteroidota bacterium]